MKTRIDFVSNSSSCSFIVNDPLKFKDALAKLGSKDGYDLHMLEVRAECSPEDKKTLEDQDIISDAWKYDGICRFSTSIESLLALDEEHFKLVKTIELECDDYETGNLFMLSVLKRALENMGVSVDSSNSEHPLMLEDEDNYDGNAFLRNVCFKAFAAK